jgi:hypothetical protein
MKSFVNLYLSTTIENKNGQVVKIFKVQKVGTKRTFFALENEQGKRICNTMFARLGEAERVTRNYLNR